MLPFWKGKVTAISATVIFATLTAVFAAQTAFVLNLYSIFITQYIALSLVMVQLRENCAYSCAVSAVFSASIMIVQDKKLFCLPCVSGRYTEAHLPSLKPEIYWWHLD